MLKKHIRSWCVCLFLGALVMWVQPLAAQNFVGSQDGTFDPATNTTMFNILVSGPAGQPFKLKWERDFGVSSFVTTLSIPSSGLLAAAVPIGMPPGDLDRLIIDGLDDTPIDICDGDWQPPQPSPITTTVISRAPAPSAAPSGCNVFQMTGSQVVPANATTAVGVATMFFDVNGNLKMTVYHNVPNAVAVKLRMGAPGTNGTTIFTFSQPMSPSRGYTQALAPFNSTNAAAIFANLYFTVEDASGEVIRGQAASATSCAVFISEICSIPVTPTTPGGGLDTNDDGTIDDFQDQFVEIVNGRDVAVDLSGHRLIAGGLERHVFAPGTRLLPGEAIVVFGGGFVNIFESRGHRGVVASSGGLHLGELTDTVQLVTDVNTNQIVDTAAYTTPIGGRSRTREPQTPGSPFVGHNTVSPDLHSAGRYNNNVIIYPPALTFTPGNFSDVAMIVRVNGAVSSPILRRRAISIIDALNIAFISPLGSLNGAPFAAFSQILPTNMIPAPISLPGDSAAAVIYDPFAPLFVVIDGLTNPFQLFNPVIGTALVGSIPPALAGQGLTLTMQCAVLDPGVNAVNLGLAAPQLIDIN